MENAQAENKVHYKYCIVPKCTNTTAKTPDKHFFTVPKDKKIRDKWCKIMKRKEYLSEKSVRYCCEDHFNIEEDTENFMRYRFMGGRLFLKKDLLPHIFACQNVKSQVQERSAFKKRRQAEYYSQVLSMKVPVSVAQQQQPEFIECIPTEEEKDIIDPISVPIETDVNMEIDMKIETKNKSVQVNIKDTKKSTKDKSCQTSFKTKSVNDLKKKKRR